MSNGGKTDFSGWSDFLKKLSSMQQGFAADSEQALEAVHLAAMAYAANVQSSPSTPVDTGQYRDDIQADNPRIDDGAAHCYAGSHMPQMFRLEFGFIGVDSLGRVYSQAPRPHWRPAYDLNSDEYAGIIAQIMYNKVEEE